MADKDNYVEKRDIGKTQLGLIEPDFIEAVGKVLTMGAQKYSADSWKFIKDAESRYYDACLRHLNAYRAGKMADDESGLPHLAHAACNIMFLLYFSKRRKNGKNRIPRRDK